MPGSTAYTPLEALLLFQYLYSYGITAAVFSRISEQLKADPQVRSAPAFDAGRLSPDALREFFLRLLKDESRNRNQSGADAEGVNGTSTQASRKRKASSPALPTLQDAAQDVNLLPQLILQFYGRYREHAVAEIREEEQRHDQLQQDVLEIQRGEWDALLQEQQLAGPNGQARPSPSAIPPRLSETLPDAAQPVDPSSSPIIEPSKTEPRQLPQLQIQRPPSPVHAQLSTSQQSQTVRNVPSSTAFNRLGLAADRPSSPLNPQTAASRAGQSPIAPLSQTGPAQPPPRVGLSPGPGNVGTPPARPIQPGSPLPSQRGGVMLRPFQVTPQVPAPIQQQQQLAVDAGVQSDSQPAGKGQQLHVPPQQINVHPPLQLGQASSRLLHATDAQSAGLPEDGSSPINAGSPFQPESTPHRTGPPLSPLVISITKILSNPSLASTPLPSPSKAKRLPYTSWKNTPDNATRNSSPTRPGSRSVSPIENPPSPEEETDTAPPSRPRRWKRDAATQESSVPSTRSGRVPSRRTRGASTTSSAVGSSVRGRTRSQSIISHASVDNESVSRAIKPEPEPSTPADLNYAPSNVDETPMPAPAAASTRRGPATRSKRKRSIASEASDAMTAQEPDQSEPPQAPPQSTANERRTIIAVRNFPRLSNPLMNDITSHRHASLFAVPVRDRDADGYSSMIRRPTDLKTIKAAISAGARATNTLSAAETPVSGAAGAAAGARDAASFAVPWSPEMAPPRGVVNSAQLERELMRMFANAVMFNPGEDDVVADAREMFESAVVSIVNFREAEKGAEAVAARRRGESEPAVEQEEEAGPPATVKRRKVG